MIFLLYHVIFIYNYTLMNFRKTLQKCKEKLQNNIINQNDSIWMPLDVRVCDNYHFKTDSFNLIVKYDSEHLEHNNTFHFNNYEHLQAKIVNVFFDKVQKSIIKTWMKLYKYTYDTVIQIFSHVYNLCNIYYKINFYDARKILTNFISYNCKNNYKFNYFYKLNKHTIRKFYFYRNNKLCNKEIKILKKQFTKIKFNNIYNSDNYINLFKILKEYRSEYVKYVKFYSANPIHFLNKLHFTDFYNKLQDEYKQLFINLKCPIEEIILQEKNINIPIFKYDDYNPYMKKYTDFIKNRDNINNYEEHNKIYRLYVNYENKLINKQKRLLEIRSKLIYTKLSVIVKLIDNVINTFYKHIYKIIEEKLPQQVNNFVDQVKLYKTNEQFRNKKNAILQKYGYKTTINYKNTINEMRKSSVGKKIIINEKKLLYKDIIKTNHVSIFEPKYTNSLRNNTNVSRHTIDLAVEKACANYKTCLTNLKNRNIDNFNLREIKLRKMIIDIEPNEFSKEGIRKNILGTTTGFYNGILFDFTTINKATILKYNEKLNKYTLHVPYINKNLSEDEKKEKIKILEKKLKMTKKQKKRNKRRRKEKIKKRNNKNKKKETIKNIKKEIKRIKKNNMEKTGEGTISLDPGVRKYLTGYSSEKKKNIEIRENIKIKKNCYKIYETTKKYGLSSGKKKKVKKKKKKEKKEKKVKREIKVISEKEKEKVKRKLENRSKKVYRQMTDFHNKVIKYLTENYASILIGDMSLKGILNKKTSKLKKKTKYLCTRLRIGMLRTKLKKKCEEKNLKYKLVNEAYTSKTCTKCGTINENLKSKETFNCNECKIIIDRDLNGARNIHLASL